MAYNQGSYMPPQRTYYEQPQQQHSGNGYANQHDGYTSGYAQEQGHRGNNRRDQYTNGRNYSDVGHQQYSSGYGEPQQHQYDPRYQQRQPRGQQQDQRMRSPPENKGYGPPSETRPRPGNGSASQSRVQQQRSEVPRQQAAPKQPSKMTMEEWKAAEKAKMKAAMALPETLAQDNAFPTFPGWQKDSRPSSRSGGASAMSHRTDGEGERPGTAQGRTSSLGNRVAQDSARPGMVRAESHDHISSSPQRPELKPRQGSHDRGTERMQQHPPQPSPLHQSFDIDEHSAQSDGYFPVIAPQRKPVPAQAAQQQPAYNEHHRPPVQRIDTTQSRGQAEPANHGQQAQSPAYRSQQPSRAQDHGNNVRSPTSAYTSTSWSAGGGPPPSKSWQQLASAPTAPSVREAPRTREDEIEQEMPDFDSAAPNQTSTLHKKAQATDQHHVHRQQATPVPVLPMASNVYANQSVQSLPAQNDPRYNQDTSSQYQNNGNTTHGYAFGFDEEQQGAYGQMNPYETDTYEEQPQSYAPPQQLPYRPQLTTSTSAHSNGHAPRRSADETRRGPPVPQRFHPNGQPMRGPLPAHMHRPEMERNYSGETIFSDPGVRAPPMRAGTAPPMRQGLATPGPGPGQFGGQPLSQQRSNPERPDARNCNPDALPHHPAPVRAGLMNSASQPPAKPAPVRNYGGSAGAHPQPHVRQPSAETSGPVTFAELDRLRHFVDANPQNPKQALILVKKLVEAANVLASEGGRADARQTTKNREKYIYDAHKRLKKLVASGYPDAQFYMADCYGQGSLGFEHDPREAFNLYLAAAKAGHAHAAFRTAMCCELGPEDGGGTRRDVQKAVQWYKRAAALGDCGAMYKCGVISLKGLMGQAKSVGEAANWLQRAADAADREHPHALHELAQLQEPGHPDLDVRNKVVPDEAYALELYQGAAQFGFKASQFRLGQAYEYGQLGLGIDNRASISWYSKAAAQGEHQAELALSGWYLTGAEGILQQSDTEAYLWARKAATSEPPLAKAMFAMGYFSESGIGCPRNIEEARRWYGRAASHKFPKAMERLEELKKAGTKGKPAPANGRLTRKDQKRDESECVVM